MVSTTWACPEAFSTFAHWTNRYSSFGSATSLAVGLPVSAVSGILQNEQGVVQPAMFSWQVRFEMSPNLLWDTRFWNTNLCDRGSTR